MTRKVWNYKRKKHLFRTVAGLPHIELSGSGRTLCGVTLKSDRQSLEWSAAMPVSDVSQACKRCLAKAIRVQESQRQKRLFD